MTTRFGHGLDVHRFSPDKPLTLGGVVIEGESGFDGHSDADLILHAITDALLGSVAAGDIGSHFPSDDERWKGASSARFVEVALEEVRRRGGRVSHLDVTYIGNRPKISELRERLRKSIATLLDVDVDRVSLKGTTTDGLGLTGRGEGACAMALVTVEIGGNSE